MRRGLELLLGVAVVGGAWFVVEFVAAPPYAGGALAFVGLDQALGRMAACALAGALAGIALGLAPCWTRPGFWLGAGLGAAAGFGLERATGFLSGQLSLDASWAAFSLGALGGPILEAVGFGPPAPAAIRLIRVAVAVVLGAVTGALLTPRGGEPGPAAMRIAFALAHLLLCGILRRASAAERGRQS